MLMRQSFTKQAWWLPSVTAYVDGLLAGIQMNDSDFPNLTARLTRIHATRRFEYPWALYACPPTGKILDVGCNYQWGISLLGQGHGVCMHNLPREVESFDKVFGFEEDSPLVTNCFRHYERKLCLLAGFLDQLPIPAETFDTIYCISVVEHVPTHEVAPLMDSMWRLLKPGGKLCLTIDWLAQFSVNDGIEGHILNHDLSSYFAKWGVADQVGQEVPWQPEFNQDTFWDGDVYVHDCGGKLVVYGIAVKKS